MTMKKLLLGLILLVPAVAAAQDPGLPGPLAVTREEYNFGDSAFTPPTAFPGPIEVRGVVTYPTSLSGGPFPLMVFLHGRHSTCFSGSSSFLEWPCTAGRLPIPSFRGYDYIADVLASHGYIVVSISANGINARDNSITDLGMQARAELLQHHLNVWNSFNTTGGAPFGTKFVGRIDMTRIGTMGHSRGGEGVMRHFLHNQSLGSPYTIRAVFPLAPVNFHRPLVTGVSHLTLLPYCDGDVSDLQGVHYFDDVRYAVSGDLTPKHTLLVMGGNHNFFNTVWTPGFGFPASDDWTAFVAGGSGDPFCGTVAGNQRLTAAEQRAVGAAYIAGFLRLYAGNETAFAPIFKGDVAPPPSVGSAALFPSYHAPDSATQRRDVNRLLVDSHRTTNQLGGAVTQSGVTPYDLCGGNFPQPEQCLVGQPNSRQPHNTPSARSSARGLSQLRAGWNATTATFTNALPAGFRDVSGFKVFQFRAGLDFTDFRNPPGAARDFRVRLTDGSGASADALVSAHSDALFYPPGSTSVTPLPKVLLNTIRIPLTAFAAINLSDVRSVEFRFNVNASGALMLTDLAFADLSGAPPAPPDLVETAVSNPPATISPGGGFSVTDTVRNQGTGGAGASTTRYVFSLDTTRSGGDILLTGSRSVPSLAATAESTGTEPVTVPPSTPAGTYFLIACADDLAVVSESNDGNNCRASTGTVVVGGTGGGPDYVVTAVSNPPASILIGATFGVTDTVQNQGSAGASLISLVRYYLSVNTTIDAGDKRLKGNRKVTALASGASSTGSKTVTVPAATSPGTYFLIACADDKNTIAEGAGEGNNCRASSGTVLVMAPDLVVTALSEPPTTRPAGGSFAVTDTTTNSGNVAAGAMTTRYYLSLNKTKGTSDILLTGARSLSGLNAGVSSTGTVTVTIPGGTSSASYFLLACADDTKAVLESNETNNCRASTTKISITP